MSTSMKQVILVRHDLKMERGKMAVQVAHAAVLGYVNHKSKEDIAVWLQEGMKKVALWVPNEATLLELMKKAHADGLNVSLVVDAGLTGFELPTKTCIVIGPEQSDAIDRITGHLSLV